MLELSSDIAQAQPAHSAPKLFFLKEVTPETGLSRFVQHGVKLGQLVEKPPIGVDFSPFKSVDERFRGVHPFANHEIGDDQSGGPRDADHAVHQDLAAALDGLVDESRRLVEVNRDVPGGPVVSRYSKILDFRVSEVVLIRIDLVLVGAFRRVQDVGEAVPHQEALVLRRVPETGGSTGGR
jgi:hypothetical protein